MCFAAKNFPIIGARCVDGCHEPRFDLPANIKFNPANGARAELDANGVIVRLENEGATRR
jgi:hypothetical protein